MIPSHIDELIEWWSNKPNYDLIEPYRRIGKEKDIHYHLIKGHVKIMEWVCRDTEGSFLLAAAKVFKIKKTH